MVQCVRQVEPGILQGRAIIGSVDGGDISSDGGVMLVAEAERKLGVIQRMTSVIDDRRDPRKVRHELDEMLAQRVFAIACSYEDCNDFDDLCRDPALKMAVGRLPGTGRDLASQPTLSRLENSIRRRELYRMSEVLVDLFVADRKEPPVWVIIDVDATGDPTHGHQQLTGFHGYYDEHCYLPLLVTARADGGPDELLATVLRPGRTHAGAGALTVLRRIVASLREAWPQVRIIIRGDSGFARPEIYDWCEAEGLDHLIGLATNNRLRKLAEKHLQAARVRHLLHGEKVRNLHEGRYAAKGWPHERRVLIKAEVTGQGDNPRFVVTSLQGDPLLLYDFYARRGEQENRIKKLKRDLAMDRTSCHRFPANQFRLLLHSAAFVLLSFIRRCLVGTELAGAQVCTLQRKLLKLGVRCPVPLRELVIHWRDRYAILRPSELFEIVFANWTRGRRTTSSSSRRCVAAKAGPRRSSAHRTPSLHDQTSARALNSLKPMPLTQPKTT